jgi:hypothetical protein
MVTTGIIFWSSAFIQNSIFVYNLMRATGELLKNKFLQTLAIPTWIMLSLLSVHSFANVIDDLTYATKIHIWLTRSRCCS